MGLKAKVSCCWRIIGTGIAFSVFMVTAAALHLTVFPLVRALPGPREHKKIRVRRVIQLSFRFFIKLCVMLGLIRKPNVTGLHNIPKTNPCILIANHPTLLDVVLLCSVFRGCTCVVKNPLWKNKFLGGGARAAEYIPNRSGIQFVRACEAELRQGRSLIIFPEGSRSPENELRPFSRGAAYLALRTRVPIVPVVMTCSPQTLMKHQGWYDVPERRPSMGAKICPPIDISVDPTETLTGHGGVDRLTSKFEAFFRAQLNQDAWHALHQLRASVSKGTAATSEPLGALAIKEPNNL